MPPKTAAGLAFTVFLKAKKGIVIVKLFVASFLCYYVSLFPVLKGGGVTSYTRGMVINRYFW